MPLLSSRRAVSSRAAFADRRLVWGTEQKKKKKQNLFNPLIIHPFIIGVVVVEQTWTDVLYTANDVKRWRSIRSLINIRSKTCCKSIERALENLQYVTAVTDRAQSCVCVCVVSIVRLPDRGATDLWTQHGSRVSDGHHDLVD